MDQRSNYLLQVLEKIGAPLMSAITAIGPHNSDSDSDVMQSAQKMAELLSRTVQVSIDLGKSMDLGIDAIQADSIRVALAALAGPMVADQYVHSGQVPNEAELRKIVASLEAVMTFSENFTPSHENIERLKQLSADGLAVDHHQNSIQFIQAMTPAVNAVAVFSFGQQEKMLIQEIAGRLTEKSMALRESILGSGLNPDEQKIAELAILKVLGEIYAICHKAETDRLSRGEGASASMNTVWQAFDARVAMLETLTGSILPGKTGSSKPASAPPPEIAPKAPPQTPVSSNPMASFIKPKDEAPPSPSVPPSTPAQEPPSESSDGEKTNPMSFFKTPKDDKNNQE